MLRQSSSPRYNAGVASRQAKLLLLLLASSALLEAQEVRVVDLLNVKQRTELRFPAAPSDCIPGEPCAGGGVGGGSVADGAPNPRDPRALGVALDRVTPTDITLDAFETEFRLFNTGLAPINVPVWPHLSDLQPSTESQPFSYLSLALEIRLSGTGPAQASGVAWVELYGSAEREDTITTLKPGEWVRVKAKVKLHTWPTQPMEAQLRGDFWFHNNVFKPQIGGGFTEAVNVYPNHTLFPAVAVHFSPTHHAAQPSDPPKPSLLLTGLYAHLPLRGVPAGRLLFPTRVVEPGRRPRRYRSQADSQPIAARLWRPFKAPVQGLNSP
jgi:hypothetical protein